MDGLERTGKTVDEAIADALQRLGASKEDVDITILEQGTKGFLGLGSKPAKVFVRKKFDPESIAQNFLKEVAMAMNLIVTFELSRKDRQLYINMKGENLGVLIGKRGQTLDALQYLVNLVVNKGQEPYISVTLDTENYRKRRKETLESLAFNLAKKAKTTKKSVFLEPMSPYERRIIHSALQYDKYVTTYSEGAEPHRYVVITVK